MSIFEIRGGQINHRYLMRKTKSDLAHMVMEYLGYWEAEQAKRKSAEAKLTAIEGLERHSPFLSRGEEYQGMHTDENGEWIKAADINAILRGGGQMNPFQVAEQQWRDDVNREAAKRVERGVPPSEARRQAEAHVSSIRRAKAHDADRLTRESEDT